MNPDVEVILFEQGENVSYAICEIPYFIAGEVKKEQLIAYTPKTLKEKKGVNVRVWHHVEAINPTRRSVVVRDLKTGAKLEEHYDRLIIATGSCSRMLGVKGENARNVYHVKTLDQGLQIRDFIESAKPKKAVIIGGGYMVISGDGRMGEREILFTSSSKGNPNCHTKKLEKPKRTSRV